MKLKSKKCDEIEDLRLWKSSTLRDAYCVFECEIFIDEAFVKKN